MKAIFTKYVGPTMTKGRRIAITDGDWHMIVPLNYDVCDTDAHWDAMGKFVKKYWIHFEMRSGWSWVAGDTKDGHVFVIRTGETG